MPRVIVVGGGILGTLHAVEAVDRGWEVVQLDLDPEPQYATVRNVGTIRIGACAPGLELDLARRARARWRDLSARAPGIGFRADGSITVATDPTHLEVFDEVLARDDAAEREVQFLPAAVVRILNPVIGGAQLGGLFCRLDAVIEPRLALPALRDQLLAGEAYRFLGGRQVWEVDAGRVVDTTGRVHQADFVVICPGARRSALATMVTARAPLRRVRLQMLQTAPLGERMTTVVADGDTIRYAPGFDVPARARLPVPEPVVSEFRIEVLCSQRASGALTIGDTHDDEEPFGFDLAERPYRYMVRRMESLLGRPLPPVVRRWEGIYPECTDDRIWYRETVDEGVLVVTGAGDRGVTLGPVIAEDTFDWIEDGVDSGGSRPGANRASG